MDSVAAFFSPAVITKTSAQWEMTLGPKTENSILKKKIVSHQWMHTTTQSKDAKNICKLPLNHTIREHNAECMNIIKFGEYSMYVTG